MEDEVVAFMDEVITEDDAGGVKLFGFCGEAGDGVFELSGAVLAFVAGAGVVAILRGGKFDDCGAGAVRSLHG